MKIKARHIRLVPHYRVELHSHCQGDPVDSHLAHSLIEHLDQAKKVGLDAVAITWHQKICADKAAFAHARQLGLLLIPGMEAEINGKHLVVLNLHEGDLSGEPTWSDIEALRARKADVFVLAPHPFYPHPTCLGASINERPDLIDAVEWCGLHLDWLPGRVNPNLRAARWATRHGKPLIATSDAHSLATIGRHPTTVKAEALTPEAIFAGIRAGHSSFHRRSLSLTPLIHEFGRAIGGQPRHVTRWLANQWSRRRSSP